MSNSPSAPQRDADRRVSTRVRDHAISECIDTVMSVLPLHDVHTCCHRERRQLVAALEGLRQEDLAAETTHGKA